MTAAMKRYLGRLSKLCPVCFLLAATLSFARDIYVAPGGTDAGEGAKNRPFRTIGMALSRARPGDRVIVRAGHYCETIEPKISGERDRPIVVEGERGPNGEFLTIVDNSIPFKAEWVPAEEIGKGVFKTKSHDFKPHVMLVNGKFIPRIWPDRMTDGDGFRRLAYPPDQKEKMHIAKGEASFWDTAGAMFGCGTNGLLYLRFRNYDDPNTKDLRIAPAGGAISIIDKSYLVFRNLLVRGGENCILIKGAKATCNIIEQCRLANASVRLDIKDGAAHNLIRDNELVIDFFAETCRTGAWESSQKENSIPYELRLKGHFYEVYKLFFGPCGTYDYGVRVENVGPGNEICGNLVHGGGQGISVCQASDLKVHDNRVYGFSSVGLIVILNRTVNVRLYDNLIYDCNINIRFHQVNEPGQTEPRSVYVYRNRLWQNPGVGEHIFFHYWKENDVLDYKHPMIFIYHNSLVGGVMGLCPSGYALTCGGLPNTLILNNIITSDQAVLGTQAFSKMTALWAAFDYNWLYRQSNAYCTCLKAAWYSEHNINCEGAPLWAPATLPDFKLPADCKALNAGLDLSKPFRMKDRDYPALPGMEPGYFIGPQPDIGAIQRHFSDRLYLIIKALYGKIHSLW